jgi:hypothetical protein
MEGLGVSAVCAIPCFRKRPLRVVLQVDRTFEVAQADLVEHSLELVCHVGPQRYQPRSESLDGRFEFGVWNHLPDEPPGLSL